MNENNKNALRSSLIIMENRLNQISLDLERESPGGGPGALEGEIDRSEALKTSEVVASMQEEISSIKRKYQLKATESSARASIMSMVIELDLLLDDLMPERLKVYGDLDKQDSDYLTRKIKKMKSMVNDIYRILHYVV